MAAAQHTFGLDVTALMGFLRFGLKWKEEDIQTFLRGHGLSVSQASLSLRTTEFLVRWQMFSEERLLHLAPQLRPFVLQIDGTCVEGGPVVRAPIELHSPGGCTWLHRGPCPPLELGGAGGILLSDLPAS